MSHRERRRLCQPLFQNLDAQATYKKAAVHGVELPSTARNVARGTTVALL